MIVINVKNLSKNYSSYKKQPGLTGAFKGLFKRQKLQTEAVKDISFSVATGELVGFLGPNGAGKTTTLKMLSGILYPTAGQATVIGFTPWQRQKEYQKQFSIVMGQKNQLIWDLPAQESFLLNKAIYEIPDQQYTKTTDYLSELLAVKDILDVPVRKLSLGQRMKCELIAALLHQPKVLFLDEPTIGLDVVSQQKIREFIRQYNQEKQTTILLTSHYMEDVVQLCSRVIIIDLGKIIYDGALDQLCAKYARHKIIKVSFTKPVNKNDLTAFGKIKEHSPQQVVLEVTLDQVKLVAASILNKLPVDDILIDEIDIDDIIRKIFENNSARQFNSNSLD